MKALLEVRGPGLPVCVVLLTTGIVGHSKCQVDAMTWFPASCYPNFCLFPTISINRLCNQGMEIKKEWKAVTET